MSKYLIDGETLRMIAKAIREKTGVTVSISPSNFAKYILCLGGVDMSNCGSYFLLAPTIEDEKDEDLCVNHINILPVPPDIIVDPVDYPTHHEVYVNGLLKYTFACGDSGDNSYHYVSFDQIYGTGNTPRAGDMIYVRSIIMENGEVVARSARSNIIACYEYDNGGLGWE